MRLTPGILCAAIYLFVLGVESKPSIAQGYQIGLNFTGSETDDVGAGSIPDTMGAVGPNHIVELLNDSYSVYDKIDGTLITRSPDDDFWEGALTSNGVSLWDEIAAVDPRLIYDLASQRWFAAAITSPRATRRLVVAVSNSSNPLDGWKAFDIDIDPANERFEDFPRLGIDAHGVYLPVTLFDTPDDGIDNVFRSAWISIPKADLLAINPTVSNATVQIYDPNAFGSVNFLMIPSIDFGPSEWRSPVIGGGLTYTELAHFTNAEGPGLAQLTPETTIQHNDGVQDVDVPNAPQPGTSALINTGSRLLRSSAVEVGNSVWYVQGVSHEGRSAIKWVEIDEVNAQLLQTGLIADPNLYLYYPSIAANEFGDVVIGFSGSSSSQYVSAYAAVGNTIDGVTTFDDIALLKAGDAPFLASLSGPVRWGDYSATVVDPADHRTFWTFQEFATDSIDPFDDYWGIQITQIRTGLIDGDFNQDGTVNAADYTVWRDMRDQSGIGLAGDGDSNGTVDIADYFVWRANFGRTNGSGAHHAPSVPEPAGFSLFCLTFAILLISRMRRSPFDLAREIRRTWLRPNC